MTSPKIVVHTDVFLEHLCTNERTSVLRLALGKFFCYVTVFQAIELFSLARSEAEVRAVEASMAALKILGLNPKNARSYGKLLAGSSNDQAFPVLVAGLCLESRLPLLTDRRKEFSRFRGLLIVPTRFIGQNRTGVEILRAARA